jgi:hypothetical protein
MFEGNVRVDFLLCDRRRRVAIAFRQAWFGLLLIFWAWFGLLIEEKRGLER